MSHWLKLFACAPTDGKSAPRVRITQKLNTDSCSRKVTSWVVEAWGKRILKKIDFTQRLNLCLLDSFHFTFCNYKYFTWYNNEERCDLTCFEHDSWGLFSHCGLMVNMGKYATGNLYHAFTVHWRLGNGNIKRFFSNSCWINENCVFVLGPKQVIPHTRNWYPL